MQLAAPPKLGNVRYEVLPLDSAELAAREVSHPLTLTVTCSPRRGNDHTIDVARRLQAHGHTVVVHVAARMVRGKEHLEALLLQMSAAGLRHVFLVGGDVSEPLGPYASALELLPDLRAHPKAPLSVGVAAYPEGHPLIPEESLLEALRLKNSLADYMVTQLCFDVDALLSWIASVRAAGVSMPVYVGIPGIADRRRLLELSLRIGVGASVSFLRKQTGVRRFARRGTGAARELHRAVAPLVGGELGIAGVHFFTFNQLIETVRLVEGPPGEQPANPRRLADRESAGIR